MRGVGAKQCGHGVRSRPAHPSLPGALRTPKVHPARARHMRHVAWRKPVLAESAVASQGLWTLRGACAVCEVARGGVELTFSGSVGGHPPADCARRGVRWPCPGRLRTPPGDPAPRARRARWRCGVRRGPRWSARPPAGGRRRARRARRRPQGSGPGVQQGGPAATGSEQCHPAAMRTWPGHGGVASVEPVIASSGATGTPTPLWHHSRRSRGPTVNWPDPLKTILVGGNVVCALVPVALPVAGGAAAAVEMTVIGVWSWRTRWRQSRG